MTNSRNKSSLWIQFLTAGITALVFAPIITRLAAIAYDYQIHIGIAANLQKSGVLNTPHFLMQAGAILLAPLTGGLFNATVVLVVAAASITAFLVCRYLRQEDSPAWLAGPLTLSLLLAAPMALLFSLDRHLYLGYISANVFHNPTILLLKPLAFISFLYAVKALAGTEPCPYRDILCCIGATIACALIKPSFTIVILPALALLGLYKLVRREQIDRRLILGGFVLPAIIILAIQFKMTYSASQIQGVYSGSSAIVLAPLAVMHTYSSWLTVKLLLSLAFPLTVLLCFFPAARKDTGLQLSWLAFFFGAAFTYLLAESGPRMYQGNFTWSAQIALFILFVLSARLLIAHAGSGMRKNRGKVYFCSAVLLGHLVFGIIFYIAEHLQTQKFW